MTEWKIGDIDTWVQVVASSEVLPGDVLLLRAGTYKGYWKLEVGGSPDVPVTIRPYRNEKVVIDGGLTFGKPHVKVLDLEIMDSDPDRHKLTDSITMNCEDCWLIGCDIHDLHNSGVNWMGSGLGGIVECLLRNNGNRTAEEVGQGHAIYTHNNWGGKRLIGRNLFFSQMGKYTIHIYSGGSNYLRDYTCEDNVICGDPVHAGGGLGLIDFAYQRNVQYANYCQLGRYGYAHQNQNGAILDNVFIGLSGFSVNADCNLEWLNLTEQGNEVYGGEPSNREGYLFHEKPPVWTRVIPFNLSRRWFASVAIYNRDGLPAVPVDFSGVLKNGRYLLRNGQNPSETFPFEYTGTIVDVPTNWTAAPWIGDSQPPATWPVFGGLVVEKVGNYDLDVSAELIYREGVPNAPI